MIGSVLALDALTAAFVASYWGLDGACALLCGMYLARGMAGLLGRPVI